MRPYQYLCASRGDYRGFESHTALREAVRVEGEKAVTPEEIAHAQDQISYFLACRSFQWDTWMERYCGKRISA